MIHASERGARGRSYVLLTPANQYASRLAELPGAVVVKLVTPRVGAARFGQYLLDLPPGAGTTAPVGGGFEHFVFGLERRRSSRPGERADRARRGRLRVRARGRRRCSSAAAAREPRVLWLKRRYEPRGGARPRPARSPATATTIAADALPAPGLVRQELLPPGDPAFDFNMSLLRFAPGASLDRAEIHDEEHGLLHDRGRGPLPPRRASATRCGRATSSTWPPTARSRSRARARSPRSTCCTRTSTATGSDRARSARAAGAPPRWGRGRWRRGRRGPPRDRGPSRAASVAAAARPPRSETGSVGEVQGRQPALAVVLAHPGQHVRPGVERRAGRRAWSAGVLARSAARRRTSDRVERGSAAWRLGVQRLGLGDQRQPGLAASVNPAPGPAADGGQPGDRRALGVAPVDVHDAVGRDLGVGQPQLLALEDERRAAQRVEQELDGARARRAMAVVVEAGGDARVVVVVEEPRRPRRAPPRAPRSRRSRSGSASASHGRSTKTKLCARCSWSPDFR